MKITICSSMSFAREMVEAQKYLNKKGHKVVLPEHVKDFMAGDLDWELGTLKIEEGAKKKKEKDLIRRHFEFIKKSDAVLVLNKEKNGIENYIGCNTLIEIAFAYVLGKKIYLLNALPKFDYLLEELKAMEPIILNGNLDNIKELINN